jgi:hypothetical protein
MSDRQPLSVKVTNAKGKECVATMVNPLMDSLDDYVEAVGEAKVLTFVQRAHQNFAKGYLRKVAGKSEDTEIEVTDFDLKTAGTRARMSPAERILKKAEGMGAEDLGALIEMLESLQAA